MYDIQDIICFFALLELVYLLLYLTGQPVYRRDRLNIAPAIIAGIIGLAQVGIGIAQKAKAAKLARENKRPDMEDNIFTQQAYDLSASQAQQGLGDSSMQAYNTANDRNMSSGINGILKSGGSSNNIASLYDGSQSGLRALALADQEAKMRNVSQFLNVGLKGKGDEDRDQFFLNKMVPFQDRAALAAGLSADGMQNVFKGVNTVGGAAMDYAGYGGKPAVNSGGTMRSPRSVSTSSMSTAPVQRAGSINTSSISVRQPTFFNVQTGRWE